jgi:hypothetical protein
MIEFGNTIYYFDLNALDKAISLSGFKPNDKTVETDIETYKDSEGNVISIKEFQRATTNGKIIDVAKYEIIKTMIEIVIDFDDDFDTALGADNALDKAPLSFKMAFNTLLNYGIIKEKE